MCRASVRKTTTVYIHAAGELRRARVCGKCADQTIRVHVGGAPARCACGALAELCPSCAERQGARDPRATLREGARRVRAAAKAYRGYPASALIMGPEHQAEERGRVLGLEQAADIIEATAAVSKTEGGNDG